MHNITAIHTSLRHDEVTEIDSLTQSVNKLPIPKLNRAQGHNTRAGTTRAMLRFVLEHRSEFLVWLEKHDGQKL